MKMRMLAMMVVVVGLIGFPIHAAKKLKEADTATTKSKGNGKAAAARLRADWDMGELSMMKLVVEDAQIDPKLKASLGDSVTKFTQQQEDLLAQVEADPSTEAAVQKKRAKLYAAADDFRLAHSDDRRPYIYARRRARADINDALEGFVEFRSAVGVARRVFGHRADVDAARADDFGPTRRRREQVRVAERHVARRNLARVEVGLGDRNRRVGQGRAADAREVFERDDEAARDSVEVCDLLERAPLARLRALAVGDVKEGEFAILLARDGRRHARVHPAGDEADGE